MLVLLSPVMLVAAILIKLSSARGPVFFRQERVGINGRRFTLYKFRTMVVGAEHIKSQLLHMNEMDGPVFKMRDDPRVTRLGRFLRRSSIDEFPQLFNVVMGHMSIVGPRPPLPAEVEKYELRQRRRLSVKPGLTCLWQVSGRNKVDFNTWMKLDLYYIDNWSWWLDLKILLRTIPAIFRGQ
jgi:lipopolysaccharide/colanic/teichoic acid biosynthesis glycosyltransferase